MKKIAVLGLFVIVTTSAFFAGRLSGAKVIELPDKDWSQGNETAQAWQEMLVSLEAAGADIFQNTNSPHDQDEGLEYLTDLLASSLEMKVAKGDPSTPKFASWMSDYRKIMGDSPDATYHSAEISPEISYEITGHKGETDYLGIMLYGRQINGWNRMAVNLADKDMDIDENGNFKVIISQEKPNNGDWLKLEDDVHMVMVRQYFHNRSRQAPASFTIKALNTNATSPNLATRLRSGTEFFNGTFHGTKALTTMLAEEPNSETPPKSYNPDFGGIFYPTPDNQYFGTWYNLANDEALIIEGDAPDTDYWSISIQNQWMQSRDYDKHQVSLNNHDIETQDGRYKVIISSKRPKTGNWLDTAGYEGGLVAIRYLQAEETPAPKITKIKLESLQQ